MINNTFITNPIRPDFIERFIYTLYKYTPEGFRLIVIDQTKDGIYDLVKDKTHLYMRPHRNLGFAKSMNEGIIHALHWGSKYITVSNDDVEFINSKWFSGIEETFAQDEKRIMAVNPMSPREPGWGYGWEHGKYIDLIEYKEVYDEKDYQYLLEGDFSKVEGLPDTFPRRKVGVIDAIATWCTVFKKEFFGKFGLFDERYYPGGGEDYDINARCYREGYRMVGTTRSWAWHHWGKSKDDTDHKGKSLPAIQELVWMNPDALWPKEKNNGQGMDPWGKWTDEKGEKHPMYRIPEISVVDI